MAASIKIDQARPSGTPSSGTPSIARNDLWREMLISLTSSGGGAGPSWSLLFTPSGSNASLSTTSGNTTNFTPDIVGTYRIQLTVDDGTGTNKQILVARVRLDKNGNEVNRGIVLPAPGERKVEANYENNTRGWDEPFNRWLNFTLGLTGSNTFANVGAVTSTIGTANNQNAELLGYYNPGDGGGGHLFWDSTSTEAHNSGTIFQVTGVTTGRWKRIYDTHTINPQWFGSIIDSSTDDFQALAHLTASLGMGTRIRSGRITLPDGVTCLSSSLELEKFGGVLEGTGVGTVIDNTGVLRWIGATTGSLIRLHQCWGITLKDMRLVGDTPTSRKPYAAIESWVGDNDGGASTDIRIQNVWIGNVSGYDPSFGGSQFTHGIVFNGKNAQNDQSSIHNCTITGVDENCIDVPNSQSTQLDINQCHFNSAINGIRQKSRNMIVANCFFSSLTNCLLFEGDGSAIVNNMGAEGVGRLLVATGSGTGIRIDGGYFQSNIARLPSNGAIIDIDGGGSDIALEIRNFNFSSDGTLTGSQAKIRVRNCRYLDLTLFDSGWYDDDGTVQTYVNHLDIAPESAGQRRTVRFNYRGKDYINHWTSGSLSTRTTGSFNMLPVGAILETGTAIEGFNNSSARKNIIQLVNGGAFDSNVFIGDGGTPVFVANDFFSSVAADFHTWRNLFDIRGKIEFAETGSSFPLITIADRTVDSGVVPLTIRSAKPLPGASGNNRDGGTIAIELVPPAAGGAQSKFYVTSSLGQVFRVGGGSDTMASGSVSVTGSLSVRVATDQGTVILDKHPQDNATPAIWLQTAGVAPSSTNYALWEPANGFTRLNSAAQIQFCHNNTIYATLDSTSLATNNGAALVAAADFTGSRGAYITGSKLETAHGRRHHVTTITGSYNVLTSDEFIAVNISAPGSVFMPTSRKLGDTYTVTDIAGNAQANNITLNGNGININGAATQVMTLNYQSVTMYYNGSNWSIT